MFSLFSCFFLKWHLWFWKSNFPFQISVSIQHSRSICAPLCHQPVKNQGGGESCQSVAGSVSVGVRNGSWSLGHHCRSLSCLLDPSMTITFMIRITLSLFINILWPINKWNDHETRQVFNQDPDQPHNSSPQVIKLMAAHHRIPIQVRKS